MCGCCKMKPFMPPKGPAGLKGPKPMGPMGGPKGPKPMAGPKGPQGALPGMLAHWPR